MHSVIVNVSSGTAARVGDRFWLSEFIVSVVGDQIVFHACIAIGVTYDTTFFK